MNSLQLIKELRLNGFRLKTDGEKINWKYVGGPPIPEDTQQYLSLLRQNKSEVIEVLEDEKQINLLAVDIETTGLNHRKDSLRLVSWANGESSGVSDNPDDIKSQLADPSIKKVFHNAAFDVPFLETNGYEVKSFTDTMLMSQVLGKKYQRHSLKAVLKREFNLEISKDLQEATNWQGDLSDKHYEYAKTDAELTYKLARHLINKLIDKNLYDVFSRNEEALPVIISMIKTGIYVDIKEWREKLDEYKCKEDKVESKALSKLNSSINLNSHQQLKHALNNRGVKVKDTKDETLARYESDHPAIKDIRRYKKLQQLVSLNKKFISYPDPDGRVRPNWKLFGSITGRMSCSKPNLQQLSYQFRSCIKPEPGKKFICCDYSQIELRVIASLSQDRRMLEAFNNGEDLHLKTAKLIYGKDNIEDKERQIAKTCNFGLIYGMGAGGLKRRLKHMVGMDVSLGEARKLRAKFLSSYKGLRRWQEKILQKNYIKTLGGKRWSTKRLNTQELFNYPVQGSAAEGLKETMKLLKEELADDWLVVALIHDEVILEVPAEEADKDLKSLKNIMARGMSKIVKDVPVVVDGIIADYWKKS